MKRVVRSSFLSMLGLRACSLVFLALAISALDPADIGKRTKVSLESETMEAGRNDSASGFASAIGHEGNSAALNRFLEDVLRARNDFKWMDHAAGRVNREPRLDDSPYADQRYSAVLVNTGDVVGRADIGYGSRLRGKRGFDRNYEATWTLQKKKRGESARDVPARVYPDNEMTFKGLDAKGVDFHASYRLPATSDRAVYEAGVMADQPLKDWAGKRDLRFSSADWPNSNENLRVTDGEDPWLRDYKPARESLVDSDPDVMDGGDSREMVGTPNGQPEVVAVRSSYGPVARYADDLVAVRGSPLRNEFRAAKPSALDSLKKTILKLRDSLMLNNGNKNKDNDVTNQSNRWSGSRRVVEIFDSEGRNPELDNSVRKEGSTWSTKRTEDESNSGIFDGAELDERYSKRPYERSKRSRRSFVAGNPDYNRPEAERMIGGNATTVPSANDASERNFANANSSKPSFSIEEQLLVHDYSINLTIIPWSTTGNKTNISALIYSSSVVSYPNGTNPIDGKSLLLHLARDDTTEGVEMSVTSPKAIGRLAATDAPPPTNRLTKDRGTNSSKTEEKSTEPIRRSLSASNGVGDEDASRGRSANRRNDKLERPEAGFLRGNTSCAFGAAANESQCRVIETTMMLIAGGMNGSRKRNREPISGVIRLSELPGVEAPAAATLSRLMGTGGTNEGVGGRRNANGQANSSSSTAAIDLAEDSRMGPLTLSVGGAGSADNKSNGNSDTDGVDAGMGGGSASGNETMNVKEAAEAVGARPRESADNLTRRKLLWISRISVDAADDTEEPMMASSAIDAMTERRHGGGIVNDERRARKRETMAVASSRDFNRISSALRGGSNRIKRSMYSSEDVAHSVPADSEGAAETMAAKEAALSHNEKQENDEEYLNQGAEELAGDYNEREEDVMEESDRAMADEREESDRKIDPIKARVNMMIKQRLDKKKTVDRLRRKRHTLNVIEYYDYDGDEDEERDTPVNEQEIKIKDDEFSNKNNAKMKRDGKVRSCKPQDIIGTKKNEHKEAIEKLQREKEARQPKEQIVPHVERNNVTKTNSTIKNGLKLKNNKPLCVSSDSCFESDERERAATKLRQNEDAASDVAQDSANVKSKWSDKLLGNRMAWSRNSEDDLRSRKITYDPHADLLHPDIIENILLDIEPVKILEPSEELEAPKEDEDFQDKRFNGRSDDYHQGCDRKRPSDVESLYEELKNVYDWSDGELKSGPRLRGDQRLRYESDDKIDANPFELQPLDDRFSSSRNDDAQGGHRSSDATWTEVENSIGRPASDYLALKVMNDMFKGGLERNSSAAENLLSSAVSGTTQVQSAVPKAQSLAEEKKSSSLRESAAPRSDRDSGSPYENREYIEAKLREVSKRNLNARNRAAISSQDLHESFVEPLDWHDDFDDNVKVRFGRGLKAMTDDPIASFDVDRAGTIGNPPGVNGSSDLTISASSQSARTSREDASTSPRGCRATNVSSSTNAAIGMFGRGREIATGANEDLEAAEQTYVNRRAPRVRRAIASYRTFYDDVNQRDSDVADKKLSSRSQVLPNVLEEQSDGTVYDGERAPTWRSDDVSRMRNLNRYSRMSAGSSRKKVKSRKAASKKTKHAVQEKHHKSSRSSTSSSGANRKHHAHRSDVSSGEGGGGGGEWKLKKRNKAHASAPSGHGGIQGKSKTTKRGPQRAAVNEDEELLYENANNRSTVKLDENDTRRKEITLLLAADNAVDDESQMDVALHGELAGKIVDQIFERVQKHDQLKSVFGPGLKFDYKVEEAAKNRQGLNERNGTNQTETTMNKVMDLLGKLILSEVQRKTCIAMSPDMQEFLAWMLDVSGEHESLDETPPLPLVREEIAPEQNAGRKFLFNNPGHEAKEDLQTKVRVLQSLVGEYNALTTEEKAKVQTVHDFLVRQSDLLLHDIEMQEARSNETEGKYPIAVLDAINATHSMTKNASSSLTHHRSNNPSLKITNKQLHDSHVAPRRRKVRSPADKAAPSKRQGAKKKKKTRENRKSHRDSMKRASASSAMRGKSRRKRADLEESDSGYEAPIIYHSFELLDARLTGEKRKKRRKKRKRELADNGGGAASAVEGDRTFDSLPIKGRNRLEDEVILLNKREAWKRENEEQLEEVAFGKDMRNNTRRERERFERLTGGDRRRPSQDETGSRTKRENVIRKLSGAVDRANDSHAVREIGESGKNSTSKHEDRDAPASGDDRLRLLEQRINVFVDKNDTATDTPPVGTLDKREKLKGQLGAVNYEAKIDRPNGGKRAGLANLTRDPVSEERRGAGPQAERQTDDNVTVKLNRATSHRSEGTDAEIELKNLRRPRWRPRVVGIYGIADWKTFHLPYDDDGPPRDQLRERYLANLNEAGDLENNFVFLRLTSEKRQPSGMEVEWKLLPVISGSPYHRDEVGASSRICSTGVRASSGVKDGAELGPYSDSRQLWRLKRRSRRNGRFNVSPVLRIIDDEDAFSLGVLPATGSAGDGAQREIMKMAGFEDAPSTSLSRRPRKLLPRLTSNKSSNDDRVAEFRVSEWADDARRLRDRTDHRMIHDDEVGLRFPVWPYRYHVTDFADPSMTFRLVPDVPGSVDNAHRYPVRAYLEYGPFKRRGYIWGKKMGETKRESNGTKARLGK